MQKDKQGTPKTRRNRRMTHGLMSDTVVNRSTMDTTINSSRAGTSRQRTTMAPTDFAVPQNLARKFRAPVDKDNESNDTELKLLYDKYLQAMMTEIILKKRAEEEEKLILSQLAAVDKEHKLNEEKLFKLKLRERDITSLTKIQNDIDSQVTEVNKLTKDEDVKTLENIFSQLDSLLQRVDVLRCSNIVIPKSSEEWDEFNKALKSCNDTSKSIMDLVGSKKETYHSLSNNMKDFGNMYSNIENCLKRVEKELFDLQAIVLKTTSLALATNIGEANTQ